MLRHRHTLGEGGQQADYPLIEPVEMSELKCNLFQTTYLLCYRCIWRIPMGCQVKVIKLSFFYRKQIPMGLNFTCRRHGCSVKNPV